LGREYRSADVTFSAHSEAVLYANFSLDGTQVVSTSRHSVRTWNKNTGEETLVLPFNVRNAKRAIFSPDGSHLLTVAYNVQIWDVNKGEELVSIGDEWAMGVAVFNQDGSQIVAMSERTASIWDAKTGQKIRELSRRRSPYWQPYAVFSPDGQLLLTGYGGSEPEIWDFQTGRLITRLSGHIGGVVSADFASDGDRIVTASRDQTVRLWRVRSGASVLARLRGHSGPVWTAAFSQKGDRIVTGSQDQTARIWNLKSGSLLLQGHQGEVHGASFDQGGARVVTSSRDGTARIWNSETGQTIVALIGHESAVRSAVFDLEGARVLTASDDKTARIWDARTGNPLLVLGGHGAGILSAAFDARGRRVVTASADGTARMWDASNGQSIMIFSGHLGPVNSAAFSSNGLNVITASSDGTARIWSVATGNAIAIFNYGERAVKVRSATFFPNDQRVVTIDGDDGLASRDPWESARIYDVATGQVVSTVRVSPPAALSAALSFDGRELVTAYRDGSVIVSRVFGDTKELIEDNRRVIPRCLTRTQRQEAFLDLQPPAWCIEMKKWPYNSEDWRDWLRLRRGNADPPLPDTPEWLLWRASRQ
jgi:WD40 repeat protein